MWNAEVVWFRLAIRVKDVRIEARWCSLVHMAGAEEQTAYRPSEEKIVVFIKIIII